MPVIWGKKVRPVNLVTASKVAGGLMLSVRQDVNQKAMVGLLQELGLVLEGHFDFGNGYHGDTYLNAHPLLDDPYRIMELAHKMVAVVPSEIREKVDVVVGPITGGALLAANIAIVLDNEHKKPGEPRVRFAPVYKIGEKLALRKHYEGLIAGKIEQRGGLRALVVDDVCNTGNTIRATRKLIEGCGGSVEASVVLYDRMNSSTDIPNHYYLAQVNLGEDPVEVKDCPCQKVHMDITQF